MSGLLILGAGGHGMVVGEAAAMMGRWETIAYLDDKHSRPKRILDWDVIGGLREFSAFYGTFSDAVVAIGDNALRIAMMDRLKEAGFSLPSIVHPTSYISPSASLGAGTVVFAQAVVNTRTQVGRGSIINTGATVDHDCVIEEGVHISPGANIAGQVKIGRLCWIGMGAKIIQKIEVGESAIVGAGAVVVKNVTGNVTVVGIPAKAILPSASERKSPALKSGAWPFRQGRA